MRRQLRTVDPYRHQAQAAAASYADRVTLRPGSPENTAVIYVAQTAAERAVHRKLATLEQQVAALTAQVAAGRRPLISGTVLAAVVLAGAVAALAVAFCRLTIG